MCGTVGGGGTNRQLSAAAAADDDDDERPIFRRAPTNITVSPGDRASLKCRVDNLGTKTVGLQIRTLMSSRANNAEIRGAPKN